ncbi:MAG: hypothetical protein KIT84_44310 [Labilithrix sp.]|nr:hypothetical protein [Labilithrix sp.]MCW5818103.1 hypothetical protein [Labilithrix sp.]
MKMRIFPVLLVSTIVSGCTAVLGIHDFDDEPPDQDAEAGAPDGASASSSSSSGGPVVVDDGTAPIVDGSGEAGTDEGGVIDADAFDAGEDATIEDAGEDATIEDAGEDAGADASTFDAGEDAGEDAGVDAGIEDAGVDAPIDAGPACVDPEDPPITLGPTPATCAAVRAANPQAGDGEYTLYVQGDRARPWQAYCAEMANAPLEYVPLIHRGYATGDGSAMGGVTAGKFVNYSQIFQEERGNQSRPTRQLFTFYDRVRVDPSTLRVAISDGRFARLVGATDFFEAGQLAQVPYATAAYCWEGGNARGSGNVDLRGTAFTVSGTAQFVKGGAAPGGSAVLAAGGQVVEISGGGGNGDGGGDGKCGWTSTVPAAGSIYTFSAGQFPLQLAHRALPQSCADVRAKNAQAADGDYVLYLDHDARRPWRAYCAGMSSGTPREYLVLRETGASSNFATYAAGGGATGTEVRTRYQRLRIDPATLRIDISDRTYASSTGTLSVEGKTLTSVPFGVAADCTGGVTGSANVDLRGTPFAVAPAAFVTQGSSAGGGATYASSDRVVDVTGGGACGRVEPAPARCDVFARTESYQLSLVYRPLPQTCAELKAEDPTATIDGEYTLWGPDARAWTAYCSAMPSAAPLEYLSVRHGANENFAQATAAGGGAWGGTNVVTSYSRIRVDPRSFHVDETDRRFTTSTGQLNFGLRSAEYGNALACGYSFDDTGRANVDMRGTPFVVPRNKFENYGYLANGSETYAGLDQVVDLKGGGLCGRREPRPVAAGASAIPSPLFRIGLVYAD